MPVNVHNWFLKKSGIADTANFGPELEFFIFDHAYYDQGINFSKHFVGSREGIWGRGDEDPSNLGYKIRLKEGYFPTPPMDSMQNIRSEMVKWENVVKTTNMAPLN